MKLRIMAVTACLLMLLSAQGAFAKSKLVLYTSQPNKDAQETVDGFMAQNPDIEVEWVRDGTTKIMAKLRAEFAAGAPRPDVLLISDMVTMEGLKAEKRLLAYPEADLSGYEAGLYDKDKTYFSTKLITTGIVYNTGCQMKSSSWKDLVKPKLKGLVAMPSPLTSGAAAIHMATLTGNPDLGWKYLRGPGRQPGPPQGRQRRHLQGRGRRREDGRHGGGLSAHPGEEKGFPGGVRLPQGGRLGRDRAGGHPVHGPRTPRRPGSSWTSCSPGRVRSWPPARATCPPTTRRPRRRASPSVARSN